MAQNAAMAAQEAQRPMARFLYYISGAKPDEATVDKIIGHKASFRTTVSNGPDRGHGNIFEAMGYGPGSRAQKPLGYYKDDQRWTKYVADVADATDSSCPRLDARACHPSKDGERGAGHEPHGRHELWIGVQNNAPPTPADLRRNAPLIDGGSVTLDDGQAYVVPLLRSAIGQSNLPTVLAIVDGKKQWVIKEDYRDLFNAAASVGHLVGNYQTIDPVFALSLAARALALNYVINEAEMCVLGTVSPEKLCDILSLLVGYPGLLKFQEEMDAVGDGETGSPEKKNMPVMN